MSKLSYALVALIVTALLFMGAVRGYQFYAAQAAQEQAEQDRQTQPFTFQNVPLKLAPPQAETVSKPVLFSERKQDVFLEDAPLPPQAQLQQAQDTIQSILADYKEDPNLRAFNRDLKQATQGQAVDLASLGGENLGEILQQNPQISEVISKHMQNPDFAKTVQQIFSNPQFIESIKQLQQPHAVQPAKKDDKKE